MSVKSSRQSVHALGERLRYLRKRRGLRLKDVAQELGITVSALAMYERGERRPPYARLAALARFYEVRADYLVFGTPDTHVLREPSLDEAVTADNVVEFIRRYAGTGVLPPEALLQLADTAESWRRVYVEGRQE